MAQPKLVKRYEAYLFRELKAVPLSLVQSTRDLKPLDVLVKQPSEEKKDGFVLVRVGSLLEKHLVKGHPLQALEGGDGGAEEQLALTDAQAQPLVVHQVQQVPQVSSEVVPIEVRPVMDFLEFVNDRDGGFFASLISVLNAKFHNQKELRVNASGIHCVSTDNGSFMDHFIGPEPQRALDVERILSRDTSLKRNEKGELELWVVTHLFGCDTLTFTAKSEKGGLSEVQLPIDLIVGAMTSVPAPIPGLKCTLGGGKRKTQLELTSAGVNSPDLVPLAFRAIRLVYGRDGTLGDRHLNVASTLPRKRAGEDAVSPEEKHLQELVLGAQGQVIHLEIVDIEKQSEASKDEGA